MNKPGSTPQGLTESCAHLPQLAIVPEIAQTEREGQSEFDMLELIGRLAADQDTEVPPHLLLGLLVAPAGGQGVSPSIVGSRLLSEFGSVGSILSATKSCFRRAFHNENVASAFIDELYCRLRATAKLMSHALAEEVQERPIIKSWQQLLDYLKFSIGYCSIEHLRILFLDRKNTLIREQFHQRGTIDHTPLYPREIVKRSLELNASAIIIVHNHPSGDLKPSRADIQQTKLVISALQPIGIAVHDHIIVSPRGHFSFKSEHLI